MDELLESLSDTVEHRDKIHIDRSPEELKNCFGKTLTTPFGLLHYRKDTLKVEKTYTEGGAKLIAVVFKHWVSSMSRIRYILSMKLSLRKNCIL